MASSALPPPPILMGLMAFLILTTTTHILAQAKTHVAPGPTPAPLNLTGILDKGGQYTTLIRLLTETQVGTQIQSQLNNSFNGLTIFAPTDDAFSNLKPGTLNGLTAQEQVSLVLYHVLPRYYSLSMFETTSNPVRTQASGSEGVYTVNVTSTSSQVNVSTGVDDAPIGSDLYTDFPLAVYSVDKVLLPYDIFGAKPPASEPAPGLAPKKPAAKTPKGKPAGGPSSEAVTTDASAAGPKGRGIGWGSVVGIGLVCIGCLM